MSYVGFVNIIDFNFKNNNKLSGVIFGLFFNDCIVL